MRKLIVANWKMNPTSRKEALRLFDSLKNGLRKVKRAEVVICPPFVYLSGLKKSQNLKLGAQDSFWEEKGAFTGEISALMLKDLGVEYVILGHSEKRAIGESDEMIFLKIKKALEFKLRPIFCIGEKEEERKEGKAFVVLEKQIKSVLYKMPKNSILKIAIAYEPVWAIGTKNPCLPDEALKMSLFIRKVVSQIFDYKAARSVRIIYGGSVKADNARDYLAQKEISGVLVGGASLNPAEFLKIASSVGGVDF